MVVGFVLASSAGCAVSTSDTLDSHGAEGAEPGPGGKADDFGGGSCASLEDDPYVLTGVSQGGKNEGKCLDTTIFRAARSLRGNAYVEAASAYGFPGAQHALEASGDSSLASTNYAIVANVKHDGEFWVAELPLVAGSIESVYYLIEEFEIPVAENLPPQLEELLATYLPEEAARLKENGNYTAAHGMLRITFRDGTPVLLLPQFPADPSRTASFRELVLSVHAVSHVPGEYDPMEGTKDAYGTARGVYSLKEKVDVSIGQLGNTIRQWKVDLDGNTIRKVLTAYLARSTERGLQDPYNTVTRNCGSELFETMEGVLGRRAGFDVRSLESIDEIPESLIFPTLGRNYPKYAEQGLVGLQVLPLNPGEQPSSRGQVTPDQIPEAYRMPTLNQQVQDGTVRLD
jgi:hypothetical protein